MESNSDFRDLFQCLNDASVRYLVVGAYAVIYYSEPRFTKDLDIWVEASKENAPKVWQALASFGAPLDKITIEDLNNPEMIYQVGIEPNRFDILMGVSGITFSEAWEKRVVSSYEDQTINILGFDELINSKKAAGRPQDLLDVQNLLALKKSGKK